MSKRIVKMNGDWANGINDGAKSERERILAIIAEMRGPFQFASTWWTLDKLVERINGQSET